jgi:WD40 repeat protein
MIKKVIGSYSRYMWNLRQLSQSFEVLRETEYNFEGPLSKYDGVSLVLEYINIICNIEQTLRSVGRSEPFTYADFLSQVRGRVLFDKCYMDTMGVSTDE